MRSCAGDVSSSTATVRAHSASHRQSVLNDLSILSLHQPIPVVRDHVCHAALPVVMGGCPAPRPESAILHISEWRFPCPDQSLCLSSPNGIAPPMTFPSHRNMNQSTEQIWQSQLILLSSGSSAVGGRERTMMMRKMKHGMWPLPNMMPDHLYFFARFDERKRALREEDEDDAMQS